MKSGTLSVITYVTSHNISLFETWLNCNTTHGLWDHCIELIIITKMTHKVLYGCKNLKIKYRVIPRKHFERKVNDAVINILVAQRCRTSYYMILPVDVFCVRDVNRHELYIDTPDGVKAVFEKPSEHGNEVAIYHRATMSKLALNHNNILDGTWTTQQYYYNHLTDGHNFWTYHTSGKLTHSQSIINYQSSFTNNININDAPFLIYKHNIGLAPALIESHITTEYQEDFVSCICVPRDINLSQLRATIKCFLNQTYQNCELCIVSFVLAYQQYISDLNVSNVRYIPCDVNDINNMYNMGIESVSGKFIMNWDMDDWHHPARISCQINQLHNNNADVCLLARYITFDETNNNYTIGPHMKYGYNSTLLIEKSKAIGYNPIFGYSDFSLFNLPMDHDCKITLLSHPGYAALYIKSMIAKIADDDMVESDYNHVLENCGQTISTLLNQEYSITNSENNKTYALYVLLVILIISVIIALIWWL